MTKKEIKLVIDSLNRYMRSNDYEFLVIIHCQKVYCLYKGTSSDRYFIELCGYAKYSDAYCHSWRDSIAKACVSKRECLSKFWQIIRKQKNGLPNLKPQ